MARQIAPIAFAVGFAFLGLNPQWGFAIGSLIGNAVDPQRIRAPGLKELPSMGVTEGAFRQVAYGTTVIRDCQLIDWGDLDVVIVEEQQGKGGGPIVESERLYQTYAVGIGEPVQAIRYIKRNGVMVYDVRPGSTILAESAEFATRFRFYDGSETQLPDPDLEALPRNGVGNTPAYRGTSYFVMVRDDLTDSRGQIPTYEVEVVKAGAVASSPVALVTNRNFYSGAPGDLQLADLIGWQTGTISVGVSPSGLYAAGVVPGGIGSTFFELRKFNTITAEWEALALPAVAPEKSPRSIAWSPNSQYLALGEALYPDTADNWIIYAQTGDTFTAIPPPADTMANAFAPICWNDQSNLVGIIRADVGSSFAIYDFNGAALTNRRNAPYFSDASAARVMDFRPGSGYVAVATDVGLKVLTVASPPVVVASITGQAEGGLWWTNDGTCLIGVANDVAGDNEISVWSFDDTPGSESLTLVGVAEMTDGLPTQATINPARTHLAVVRTSVGTEYPPAIYSISQDSPPTLVRLTDPADVGGLLASAGWAGVGSLPQYDAPSIGLDEIVADICDRCSIPAGKLDLAALTDQVRGVTLGGSYDGAGAITTLMPAFLFDVYEADRELRAVKRGGAVVATLTDDDLAEEPDENTLRGQGIEYPRALQLKYLNPGQDYAAPAATVTNKTTSSRVRGEVSIDLPVAFDETEALNVASRMLKVMWEDVNGEAVFSLPSGPFAWLTPTDCLGLSLRGALYRIRVEKVEQTGGLLKVTARRDRQSAYTSNLTAIPLPAPNPPPPSLAGVTTFVPMNIPGRIDSDDQLGFHFAMTGLPGTAWQGANIAYRVDGTTEWTSLGNFTTRAVMGTLTAALPAASEFYTDTTNTLAVELIGTDQLETITEAQFLSEGNPAAIVYPDGTAELLQFRDVVDEGSQAWSLTTLQRGRLATVPGPHLSGARFVVLAGSQFVALPSALIGLDLQFRVTSIGTSPEVAPIYDFTWNPVHSQREFPPAHLTLSRAADVVTAVAVPRHRFGTEDLPVASVNWTGYRFTATDGANTLTTDTATVTPTAAFDVTGWATPITITAAMTNRFTGAGPDLSEVIA